jgi:hypothetical protein
MVFKLIAWIAAENLSSEIPQIRAIKCHRIADGAAQWELLMELAPLEKPNLNHFLSLLYQTRACTASQRRDLTWELKGGITFYSLVCFSFLESNKRTVPLPFEEQTEVYLD